MFFRNDNDHRAYPFGRPDLAMAPGAVVKADGKDADALSNLSGVVELKGDEGQTALNEYREGLVDPTLSDESPAGAMTDAVGVAREITNATVTGPLNRVIGDDQAPHGPGTGTITTKQAVQERDSEHFGPHEATAIGPVGPQAAAPGRDAPTSADVHNDQLEAGKRAGALSEHLLGDALTERPADNAGDDDEFDPSAPVGEDVTADDLESSHSKEQLEQMAEAREGVAKSGTKLEIATAVVEHDKTARASA